MTNAPRLYRMILSQVASLESRAVPDLRPVRCSITSQLKSESSSLVFDLVVRLLSKNDFPKWFAYELIHGHRQAMDELNVRTLENLGEGLNAWGDADAFSCYLSGPAWRNHKIRDITVHKWAQSPNRWWRRIAIVSTVPLNNTARGGTGDASRTIAVCELVKGDRDDTIVKALSWALRELAKKDPIAVGEYLSSERTVLSSRVLREVQNKLIIGVKNPKRLG
ncbi:MAG: DNA alkylation repair protein [Pirellula sp.]